MFKVYGFNLKEIAMFAWMPMLFADLGCILGGYLPPLFQRWFGVNLIVSRKMVVTLGAVLMIGGYDRSVHQPVCRDYAAVYRWFCSPGTVWRADYALF